LRLHRKSRQKTILVKRKKKRYLLKSVALSELATKNLGWLAHTTNNYLPGLNERFHAFKVFPASFSGYNWIVNKRRGEERRTYDRTSSLFACASGLSGRMQRNSLDIANLLVAQERTR
jgi:hypothetical protein